MFSDPDSTQRRVFAVAAPVAALVLALIAVLLLPWTPLATREAVGGLGLLLAGATAVACTGWRARISSGRRRRSWALLSTAGLLALTGNLYVAASGADPGEATTSVSDLAIAAALVLSIASLLFFPGARRRGVDLLLLVLDGLIMGVGIVIIAAVLVYSSILGSTWAEDASTVASVVIPGLDVLLVTVALLLLLRTGGPDRPSLALVAAGFLMYAVSDLLYVVRVAQDTFAFGTLHDLGWITGYVLIALAACYPGRRDHEQPAGALGRSETADTVLVFGVLLAAVLTQVLLGASTGLDDVEAALWVALSVTAGTRQVVLSRDNLALRRGLELRVAEQTADLHRMARQTEVLLASVGDGIYGVDERGRVTFVNPSGAAALGRSVDELLGESAHGLFHAPAETGQPFPYRGCYVAEAVEHGAVSHAEEDTYARPDGTTFPVEITASPLIDNDEAVGGAVVVFRDITQRREVDRMKNEFLSIVSHELRTPLTSIRGSLGLLAGGKLGELSPRAATMAGIALESSERLTRLINDILDLERISSGTRPMELLPRSCQELVEASAAEIAGLAQAAGVRVAVGRSTGEVLADRDLVVQTLTNLLGNAVKFSDPGSTVVVEASAVGTEVLFSVRDHGRGIPADMLDRVFERFQQVDSSDSRQQGGTGLGLAISKGIVERHGGRIWAESEPGVGTVVQFRLPALSRSARLADTGGLPGSERNHDAPTILVCDDDPATVETFTAILSTHGYRTLGVTNGAEAIEVAIAERPAAVLLDLAMPGTDGARVLRELKASERTRYIPVVIVSGLTPGRRDDLAPGADGWLVKPVSEQRLIGTVALTLDDHHQTSEVLLVEDDQDLADVLVSMLCSHGVRVVHATTAAEALRQGRTVVPQVLVLDLDLPDGHGRDVVAGFRLDPALAQVPVVVYSAAEVDADARDELALGSTLFLTKGRIPPAVLEDRVLHLINAVTGRSPAVTAATAVTEGIL